LVQFHVRKWLKDRATAHWRDKSLHEPACRNDINDYVEYPFPEHMPKMFQLMMAKWRVTYKEDTLAADFTAAWGKSRFCRHSSTHSIIPSLNPTP
jgi:hypothetical protein